MKSPRSFTAKYPGTCTDCGDAIVPGDKIVSVGSRSYAHADHTSHTPDVSGGGYRGMCEDAPCCGCCGTNIYGVYQGG